MARCIARYDCAAADRRIPLSNVLPLCFDSLTQEVTSTCQSNCMRIKYSVFTDQNTCNLLISLGSLDRIKIVQSIPLYGLTASNPTRLNWSISTGLEIQFANIGKTQPVRISYTFVDGYKNQRKIKVSVEHLDPIKISPTLLFSRFMYFYLTFFVQ